MNVAIIVAIVALVSTIVGATIGAVTNYFLAVRRERADRERDDRNHAVEIKRAARLIESELLWARTAAKGWVGAGVPLVSLSTEARQKYLDTIAPDLSDEVWTSVTIAVQAAETIRVMLGTLRDRPIAIADDVTESFVPLLTSIDEGCRGLALYIIGFPGGRQIETVAALATALLKAEQRHAPDAQKDARG